MHARGRTKAQLFKNAALGMFSLMGSIRSDKDTKIYRVTVHADSIDMLLHAWLSELLFLFDAREMFIISLKNTTIIEKKLSSTLLWTDSSAVRIRRRIKAVTLHGLKIQRSPDGYRASVIFDI